MSKAVQNALRLLLADAAQDTFDSAFALAMQEMLEGPVEPAVVGALCAAMRAKGERASTLATAARALREKCDGVHLAGPLLDTCGTGGDGANTFNISTASAIVVASCGVRVAKHGNRAVSSRAGSADVLESLGIRIDRTPADVVRCVDAIGIDFLFAPAHHSALRHVAPVRKMLGVRTFFNLLGPMANPAGATHQVVGVYSADVVHLMAECLRELGVERAWVVHADVGLDEIATEGETLLVELCEGELKERKISAADFGLEEAPLDTLQGGDREQNAAIIRDVLDGHRFESRAAGPRKAVVLNAAAGLCVALGLSPLEAAHRATEAIDSGKALSLLETWSAHTNGRK